MNGCSARFIAQLESALTANIRLHSVDSFVQTYKVNHPEEVVPSTKTIYRYIKEGLLAIKPIDLPKMVSIRKRSKKVMKTNKKTLGKSIEERPEYINDRSEFGHWEIDLVLGKKTKGEAVDVYFAHPYSSHERGTNENFNGLLREYVPKGISLNPLTSEELDNYLTAINERPRRLLQYQSSTFLFELARTA
ncbi:transposase [Streptococcus pyogenes]|nr:transposase [Streptococcus pyogenes]VHB09021.1 transposase [Streptococcus pyogenes]VHC48499.1 transposase [Streptococcus pyogenes]